MARIGKACGYFVGAGSEKPTKEDVEVADKSKNVYLVKESVLFERHVSLKSLGIKNYQFGKPLTEQEFEQIRGLAGKKTLHTKNQYKFSA